MEENSGISLGDFIWEDPSSTQNTNEKKKS